MSKSRRRTVEITGLEVHQAYGTTRHRFPGRTSGLPSRDAWRVTPRQARRMHKRLHKMGIVYSGKGLTRRFDRFFDVGK